MTAFRVWDTMPDHPKFEALADQFEPAIGMMADSLWLRAGAWCARHLTDGYIPRSKLRRLYPGVDLTPGAEALVAVGLWEREGDGYRFHDWLEYQDSKDKVERDRALSRERKRRWKDRKEAEFYGDDSASVTRSEAVPVTRSDSEVTRSEAVPERVANALPVEKTRVNLASRRTTAPHHTAPHRTASLVNSREDGAVEAAHNNPQTHTQPREHIGDNHANTNGVTTAKALGTPQSPPGAGAATARKARSDRSHGEPPETPGAAPSDERDHSEPAPSNVTPFPAKSALVPAPPMRARAEDEPTPPGKIPGALRVELAHLRPLGKPALTPAKKSKEALLDLLEVLDVADVVAVVKKLASMIEDGSANNVAWPGSPSDVWDASYVFSGYWSSISTIVENGGQHSKDESRDYWTQGLPAI